MNIFKLSNTAFLSVLKKRKKRLAKKEKTSTAYNSILELARGGARPCAPFPSSLIPYH
jgi:hypothetical protein